MIRRFEFVGGSSAKFYEVQVDGTTVTVRYGRIGADGQTLTKAFPNVAKAQAHGDKLIGEKIGKGYRETTGSVAS